MKLTLTAGSVHLDDGEGTVRSLTLEQFSRHARDPEFLAKISAADRAAVQAAIDAAAAPPEPPPDK